MKKLFTIILTLIVAGCFAQTPPSVNPFNPNNRPIAPAVSGASVSLTGADSTNYNKIPTGPAVNKIAKDRSYSAYIAAKLSASQIARDSTAAALQRNGINLDSTYFALLSNGGLTFKPASVGSGTSMVPKITFSNISGMGVTVNWTSVGALYYSVYRYVAGNPTGTLLVPNTTALTYNDSGLATSTNYTYSVVPTFGSSVTTSATEPVYTTLYDGSASNAFSGVDAGNVSYDNSQSKTFAIFSGPDKYIFKLMSINAGDKIKITLKDYIDPDPNKQSGCTFRINDVIISVPVKSVSGDNVIYITPTSSVQNGDRGSNFSMDSKDINTYTFISGIKIEKQTN